MDSAYDFGGLGNKVDQEVIGQVRPDILQSAGLLCPWGRNRYAIASLHQHRADGRCRLPRVPMLQDRGHKRPKGRAR